MRRERWLAVVFATVLFFCGAAAGALSDHYLSSSVVAAKTAETYRQRYLLEMQSKLKLSGNQVNQLEVILDQTKKKFKAVREGYRPAILKIKAEQISQVKSILNPDQIPAYEQLVAERERRAKEQEEQDRRQDLAREASDRAKAGR